MPTTRIHLRDTAFKTAASIVDNKVVIEGEFALGDLRFSVSGTTDDWRQVLNALKEQMLRVVNNPLETGVDLKEKREQLRRLRILEQMNRENPR